MSTAAINVMFAAMATMSRVRIASWVGTLARLQTER